MLLFFQAAQYFVGNAIKYLSMEFRQVIDISSVFRQPRGISANPYRDGTIVTNSWLRRAHRADPAKVSTRQGWHNRAMIEPWSPL